MEPRTGLLPIEASYNARRQQSHEGRHSMAAARFEMRSGLEEQADAPGGSAARGKMQGRVHASVARVRIRTMEEKQFDAR